MAEPYRRKGSRYWWISPVVNGLQMHMSTGLVDYDEARKKLRELEGDIARGIPIASRVPLFRELLEEVRVDYKIKRRRSLGDLEKRIDKHLEPALGHIRAARVGESEINHYILRRQNHIDKHGRLAPAANATINRELAIIKRAFKLARRIIPNPPRIEMLPEDNIRDVSYNDEQFQWMIDNANTLLRDLVMVWGYTGWRKTSVQRIQWPQVDLKSGWIFLNANETKNRKATKFRLISPLKEIFEERRRVTDELQRQTGQIIPWVFHRNGRPIKSIQTAFNRARIAAGLPGHKIHDFRRTAVRTLHELGYDSKTIMDMCGFKTEAMVNRYIGMTSERRLSEAGEALRERRSNLIYDRTDDSTEAS